MKKIYNVQEQYFTPAAVVNAIINQVGILNGVGSILEPCAGSGNIVKAIRDSGYDHHITAVELDPLLIDQLEVSGPDVIVNDSFFKLQLQCFDLVIMNPPYSNVEGFVEKAFQALNNQGQVAAILRLSHLVGVKRWKMFNTYKPSEVHILSQRAAFSGGCGDIGGYAWFIWDKPLIGKDENTIMKWLKPTNDQDKRRNNGSRGSQSCKANS